MSARDRLEALRRLNGRIEGLERQRAGPPKRSDGSLGSQGLCGANAGGSCWRLVASGVSVATVAEAVQVTPAAVASLVRARSITEPPTAA